MAALWRRHLSAMATRWRTMALHLHLHLRLHLRLHLHPASASGSTRLSQTGRERPIFIGQRLTVFEWQLDGLRRLLGSHTDSFDLPAWFQELDAQVAGVVDGVARRHLGRRVHALAVEARGRRGAVGVARAGRWCRWGRRRCAPRPTTRGSSTGPAPHSVVGVARLAEVARARAGPGAGDALVARALEAVAAVGVGAAVGGAELGAAHGGAVHARRIAEQSTSVGAGIAELPDAALVAVGAVGALGVGRAVAGVRHHAGAPGSSRWCRWRRCRRRWCTRWRWCRRCRRARGAWTPAAPQIGCGSRTLPHAVAAGAVGVGRAVRGGCSRRRRRRRRPRGRRGACTGPGCSPGPCRACRRCRTCRWRTWRPIRRRPGRAMQLPPAALVEVAVGAVRAGRAWPPHSVPVGALEADRRRPLFWQVLVAVAACRRGGGQAVLAERAVGVALALERAEVGVR